MRVKVNLNLHDDFLLTCETMHIDIKEAIKCYARNVKLFEATHDENNTIQFEATKIFFCVYTHWCFSQNPTHNHRNNELILNALTEIEKLKEKEGLKLDSVEYKVYIKQLFNQMNFSYATKKIITRSSR